MNTFDIRSIPIASLQKLKELNTGMQKTYDLYSDYIIKSDPDKFTLTFHDREAQSPFYFKVSFTSRASATSPFALEYAPASSSKVTLQKIDNQTIGSSISLFAAWCTLIKQYSTFSFEEEGCFQKEFEEDIYQEFEIADEENSHLPLPHSKQLLVYKFTTSLEEILKSSYNTSPFTPLIMDELQQIKEELPNASRRRIVKKLAKVFGILKKYGWEAITAIGKELKKEMLKKGVNYLIDHGADIIKYLGNSSHH